MSEGERQRKKSFVGEYEHEAISSQKQPFKITVKNSPEKAGGGLPTHPYSIPGCQPGSSLCL